MSAIDSWQQKQMMFAEDVKGYRGIKAKMSGKEEQNATAQPQLSSFKNSMQQKKKKKLKEFEGCFFTKHI